MYNNRALVPDSAVHMADWAQRSREVRAQHVCTVDRAYGDLPSETLDIFPPQQRIPGQGCPVLVFIHGGYWRALDKSDHSFLAPAFTAQACVVVVLNYALCPGTPDAPVSISFIGSQITRALQWVSQHIAAYGGDPDRITVAGHSAGGQLAALMLAAPGDGAHGNARASRARNALSISGLHDLQPLVHSPLLQSVLQISPADVQSASPCRLPAPVQGTLACAVGADESAEFLRQNLLMQQAWGTERVPSTVQLPGLNHFTVMNALAAPGTALHALALSLLFER